MAEEFGNGINHEQEDILDAPAEEIREETLEAAVSYEHEVKREEAPAENRDFQSLLKRVEAHAPNPVAPIQEVRSDADRTAALDEESRITHLVSLAETKGVPHAVQVARSLKDFYALDMMHDELAEQFHAALHKGNALR